jgi:transposase-like protein
MIKARDGRAAVLRALEHSGLSMAEFCRRRGLPYGTVAVWRSKARRAAGRFIEVETPHAAGPQREAHAMLCAELALPGGAVLRVYHRGGEGGGA